jgi:hypothetical protein
MYNSGIEGVRIEPEVLSGAPVPFRFELSCLYLTQPEGRMPAVAPCMKNASDSLAGSLQADSPDTREMETILPFIKQHDTPTPRLLEAKGSRSLSTCKTRLWRTGKVID